MNVAVALLVGVCVQLCPGSHMCAASCGLPCVLFSSDHAAYSIQPSIEKLFPTLCGRSFSYHLVVLSIFAYLLVGS